MDKKTPFRINYPLDILMKSKKIDFNNENERIKIFRRNIFYYKYGKKENNFLEKRYNIYFLLAEKVLKLINKDYPSLDVLNISVFGSSLFSKNPGDFDFLIIVKGNVFLLKETEIILKENKKSIKYSVGISIKGLDNFTHGIFDLQSKTSVEQQNQIINRTAISLFRRHIPLIGYDFIENKNDFIENIYAQISDLLSNTYNLYYLKKERPYLNDKQRARKILSRLYEAASYLEFLENDLEVVNLRKEIYLDGENNMSFSESKKLFDRFKLFYIKKSQKLRVKISKKLSFHRDNIEFNQILKKTKELLSKKRIGNFLPVMAKIIDSEGNTIAFSKRIKQSNGLKMGPGPIHAEICAIYNAKSKKKINWDDYTLYCSLEPCSTCTRIITELGIKKVVYCLADPLLSYYGRRRAPYLKKNTLFYRHNSPELIMEFQKIYTKLYKRKISSKKELNVLEILLDMKLKENIINRLEKYWKNIKLPHIWVPSILKILSEYSYNEDLAAEKVREKFPSLIKKDSLDYSKKLLEWRKRKVKNLAKRINKYVVGGIIGDVGGRTKDFIEQILNLNKSIKKAYITDIGNFSTESKNHKISFVIQTSTTKLPFAKNSMSTIILSMVLHHLKSLDQRSLVKNIISSLKKGGRIILIEDTYPKIKSIKGCNSNISNFLKFNSEKKKKILSFYDWFGNRLMRNRDNTSLAFNFKTMEEWKKFFEKYGMTQINSEFIKEAPSNPDIFPPKAIMVFQKKTA